MQTHAFGRQGLRPNDPGNASGGREYSRLDPGNSEMPGRAAASPSHTGGNQTASGQAKLARRDATTGE
jgi:hypothetical protein